MFLINLIVIGLLGAVFAEPKADAEPSPDPQLINTFPGAGANYFTAQLENGLYSPKYIENEILNTNYDPRLGLVLNQGLNNGYDLSRKLPGLHHGLNTRYENSRILPEVHGGANVIDLRTGVATHPIVLGSGSINGVQRGNILNSGYGVPLQSYGVPLGHNVVPQQSLYNQRNYLNNYGYEQTIPRGIGYPRYASPVSSKYQRLVSPYEYNQPIYNHGLGQNQYAARLNRYVSNNYRGHNNLGHVLQKEYHVDNVQKKHDHLTGYAHKQVQHTHGIKTKHVPHASHSHDVIHTIKPTLKDIKYQVKENSHEAY